MSFEFDFLPLFIVMALAWLCPLLTFQLRFIRIPSVIVEIIAGFVIGKHALNILPSAGYMEFLGLTGFVFLMFLSGLEIDVHKIVVSLPTRKLALDRFLINPLLTGVAIYVGTLLLAIGGTLLLSYWTPIKHIWYFALIISTSSVGIILPILKERGEISHQYGQMIVLAAAVADLLSILMFTFTSSMIKKGFEFEVLLTLSLFVAFFVAYRIGRWLVQLKVVKRLLFQLSHAAAQIKVRGTLALILLFLILSQIIDAEVILGAFLVGILMSYFSDKERSSLLMKLDAIGHGFLVPIFFIMVGASLDLEALADLDHSVLFLVVLVIILFVVKVIPSLIWTKIFGFQKAVAGGFLLSSRLSLIIAASQVGLELGIITEAMNTAFILVAIVTCLLSPILYTQMNKIGIHHEDKTIIVGGGAVGVLLARSLKMHGKPTIIIETDALKVHELEARGYNVVHSSGLDAAIYRKVKIHPENYVIISTDTVKKKIQIAQMLRSELQHERVISYAARRKNIDLLKNLEIESLDVSHIVAIAIENLVFRPTTYQALFESFESFNVEELSITSKEIDGELIKDIPFHQDGFLMLIRRDGEMIVPHGNNVLRLGDVAIVFGSRAALMDFRRKFTSA